MNPAINIVLHKDGTVTVFPEGIKGERCKEFTKPFEDALGMDDSKDKKTPDYYQKEKAQNSQRV